MWAGNQRPIKVGQFPWNITEAPLLATTFPAELLSFSEDCTSINGTGSGKQILPFADPLVPDSLHGNIGPVARAPSPGTAYRPINFSPLKNIV